MLIQSTNMLSEVESTNFQVSFASKPTHGNNFSEVITKLLQILGPQTLHIINDIIVI